MSLSANPPSFRLKIAHGVAKALARLVALFRPLSQDVEVEVQTTDDGADLEVEVPGMAWFVQPMTSAPWAHFDAWVSHSGDEGCLNVQLLGYWIEVWYLRKQAPQPA